MAKVTRAEWLDAGLEVLAAEGPQALVAERLASRLGVTRGSFYHHFRSRELFEHALLERWAQRYTRDVIDATERSTATRGSKLDRLLANVLALPHEVGTAVRAWAQRDPLARRFQTQVDARRIAYLQKVLASGGLTLARSRRLAQLSYLLFVGLQHVYAEPNPRLARELFGEIQRLAGQAPPPKRERAAARI